MSDHFERLGLPRRFSIDEANLEREYLARSRQLHPDYHTNNSTAEQHQASLEATAKLNEAYLTLKEPFRRANYLLQLLDGPSAQQEKNLDQAFLMEMMELQEELEQRRNNKQSLADIEQQLNEKLASLLTDLELQFARIEASQPGNLIAIRRLLNAAKTLQSLKRQLEDD